MNFYEFLIKSQSELEQIGRGSPTALPRSILYFLVGDSCSGVVVVRGVG